jgi:hypothetical protein
LAIPPERLGFKTTTCGTEDGNAEQESSEAKQEIDEGLHKLETLLNSTVDKNFDKFEIYVLRNILSVPPELVNWVRLSHYDVSDTQRLLRAPLLLVPRISLFRLPKMNSPTKGCSC